MRLVDVRLLLTTCLSAAVALSQTVPRIGVIEFYGNRKTSEQQLRKALQISEGSPLPPSKGDAEDRLSAIPAVAEAHLEATCCDDGGKTILYVGIQEKDTPTFEVHPAPAGEVSLPAETGRTYAQFLAAVTRAARNGHTAEDLTAGHSLMEDQTCRALQLQFIQQAAKYLPDLRKVLRTSNDEEQRAIAAYVIGYAADKKQVLDDLVYALHDADATVRNNAMRSLGAFSVLARMRPELKLNVSPAWFIPLLNSLVWSDRQTASAVLVTLTEDRDPGVLEEIKAGALPSLIEMARWKHLEHALPPYILAGRVGGIPEKDLQEAWSKDDRESVISRVSASATQSTQPDHPK